MRIGESVGWGEVACRSCKIQLVIMPEVEEGLIQHTYRVAAEQLARLGRFLRETTAPLVDHTQPKLLAMIEALSPYFYRTRELYFRYQLLILVTGAVAVTYLVVRPRPTEDNKQEREKRKKLGRMRRQLGNRTFISDNSEADAQEQPSTGTRGVESSGKQVMQKKKTDSKHLERIESSSQEEETGDKIFFEVYKTYQVSSDR